MAAKIGEGLPYNWIGLLCIASFFMGLLFAHSLLVVPEAKNPVRSDNAEERCGTSKPAYIGEISTIPGSISETQQTARSISSSEEMVLDQAMWRASQETGILDSPPPDEASTTEYPTAGKVGRPKVFVVVGINTAFSSRKRRDSIRQTWMPRGERLTRLEKQKGIVVRFVIGHGSVYGGILDRAIDAEDMRHHDFLRLAHVEGYNELSAKTKIYFATAVSIWDAEYYVKVDDDVHVNLGTLAATLARHRTRRRVYIGCMKSGPVLAQKGVRYHEPEHWKFGEQGNKYFRHATGQLYALSHDLAEYISKNLDILHKYANEDVSLGAWFIGLDVDHIDDRRMCCGTPPDCEWKLQAGNTCVASFDWSCSGICKSVDRLRSVHQRCAESEDVLWKAAF